MGKSKAGQPELAAPLAPLNARLGDWTGEYRDETRFAEGFLDQLTLPGQVSALAYEPGVGLLAVGTSPRLTQAPRLAPCMCTARRPCVSCSRCAPRCV